jgi:hypothetical protein
LERTTRFAQVSIPLSQFFQPARHSRSEAGSAQRSFDGPLGEPLDKFWDTLQSWRMSTPRLPGPHVIAALFLATAIVSAVSIKGPIPIPYDLIKDFQPMIAAVVALCAAALAYYAAQAKVNFDRSVYEAGELRRKANLVRKLRYAALISFGDAQNIRKRVVPAVGATVKEIDRSSFIFQIPKEFDEAWEHVDVFDQESLLALTNVRYNSSIIVRAQAALDDKQKWSYRWPEEPPADIATAVDAVKDLEKYLAQLVQLLPRE